MEKELDKLLQEVRACMNCAGKLPFSPRPVLRISTNARLLIIGQAPGTRVHETGIPWNDKSGERLRGWLGMSREDFYDENTISIMPMGLCYPGRGKSGDSPPSPECAPLWHGRVQEHMKNLQLTLLIGQYAINYYLKGHKKENLTETVRNWKEYLPLGYFPLVHPSPRNTMWLKRNPWFEKELVPELRNEVYRALKLKSDHA